MARLRHTTFSGNSSGYRILLMALGALVINGLLSARYMDQAGHWVTGMSNQVVWGVPHIFAIFLIITASGVLNIASISSVFERDVYKGEAYTAWARLSALLAITLLLGGVLILVLDLGRPERLIVAMTHYNFKSVFAWNVFLYTGFVLIVVVYLWMMFEQHMHRFVRSAGIAAFAWRILLTAGTGSIFGVLVARQAYDMAIMAPLFIAMSLSFGSAFFVLILAWLHQHADSKQKMAKQKIELLTRLRLLLGNFVIAVLFITALYHLTKLYATELHDFEKFILIDGGIYPAMFWFGQVLIGSVVPLLLLFWRSKISGNISTEISMRRLVSASALVIVGGFAQLYVLIIGGQAYPLEMFPGMAVSSSFFDGEIARYTPSFPEFALGFGGIAFALLLTILALRVLPFLPSEDQLAGNQT